MSVIASASSTRLHALSAIGAALALLAACSCSEGGDDASTDSSGSASGNGGGGTGAAPTTTGNGGGGNAGAGGQNAWTPVEWAPEGCTIEHASQPAQAAPILTWVPCASGTPGCEMVSVNWTFAAPTGPMVAPSVVRMNDGHRVGALIPYDDEYRTIIWDDTGAPLSVWRTVPPQTPGHCNMVIPRIHESGYWFGAQLGAGSVYFYQKYADLGHQPVPLPTNFSSQAQAAGSELFAMEQVGGMTLAVGDRTRNQVYELKAATGGGVHVPHPVNDIAPFLYRTADNQVQGWLWRRSTESFVPMVVPPTGESIWDFRSDGSTMVWPQTPMPDATGYPPAGNLWTSAHTDTQSAMAPVIVATIPAGFPSQGFSHGSAIGEGYYATVTFSSTDPGTMHVYRLSDGHHWSFAPEPKLLNGFAIAYVDSDAVWYRTLEGVYRQSLGALGPGD